MKTIPLLSFVLIVCMAACKQKTEVVNTDVPTNVPVTQTASIAPPAYAKIAPPIEGLDPGYKRFTIHSEKAKVLRLSSGTRISVPASAFVDEKGQPVSGKVELQYREFHDAVDIFVSGIPMEIMTDKGEQVLETAGMFDIRAHQNGKALSLAEGKTLKVEMASRQKGAAYDVYHFGENTTGWQKIGKGTQRIVRNEKKLKSLQLQADKQMTMPLGNQYFVFNYGAVMDVAEELQMGGSEVVKPKVKAYGFDVFDLWCNEPIQFEGAEYPAGLMLWKYEEGTRFHTMNPNQRYTIKLTPYFDKNKYQIEVDGADYHEVTWIECVMPLKSLFAFSPEYWRDNYDKAMAMVKEEAARVRNQELLLRGFEINKLGIFNYDKIMKNENALMVDASFTTPKTENPFPIGTVFYFPENNQTVIQYPPSKWKQMAVLPQDDGRLLTVLPGGKLGFFSVPKYRQIPFSTLRKQEKPAYVFDFALNLHSAASPKQLRELLGM